MKWGKRHEPATAVPPPETPMPPVTTGVIDQSDHICACGNRRLTAFMNVQGGNMLACCQCGSFFSDMVASLQQSNSPAPLLRYSQEEEDDMRHFVASCRAELIAEGIAPGAIAVATDHPDLAADMQISLAAQRVQSDAITPYDAIILPDLTSHIAFPRQTLIALSRCLVPNGQLLLRARSAAHPDLTANAMGASPAVRPADHFYFLSRECCEILCRNSSFRDVHLSEDGDHWLLARTTRGPRLLDVAVMAGIGDVLWCIVLTPALLAKYGAEKLRLFVQDPSGDGAKRSNALLERFDLVDSVIPAKFDIYSSSLIDPATGFFQYLQPGPIPPADQSGIAPFSYRFIINPFLENGLGFEEIARRLELDPALLDYDIFARYKEMPGDAHGAEKIRAIAGTNYIVFYFSSRHFNTTAGFNRGALWRPEDWVALGRLLHEALGCRIVITGAAYDLDYLRDFVRQCDADFHDTYINIVGQYDIIDTREVLKHARMIIGYPSGIPIMGVYLNTPTAMFWRPRHLPFLSDREDSGFDPGFAHAWVPPDVLRNGRYLDLWFGEDTPETVFARIAGAGW